MKDWTERTSIVIRTATDGYTTRAVRTFAQLGSELNKVTGYGEIELLKKRVKEQGNVHTICLVSVHSYRLQRNT